MSVRHSRPVEVSIGPLLLGQVATINDTSDGLSNPQNISYSIRNNVVQNETFPRKTTLCAQLKSVWEITVTFCTVRTEDKIKVLQICDPNNGGGAGPYSVVTELLGERQFWLESTRVTQPNGMDPDYYQWDLTLVEDIS
jgi:hypothetical protein